MAKIVSVIDIGSNSVRMAIFAKTSRLGFHLLEEKKSRVRISQGSYENQGYLQEESIRRTIHALSGFVKIAKSRGSRKILCVATSAVRDAPNNRDFLKRVKNECGLQIKIISGEKEAYYGALACLNLLPKTEGISIDVGGGSSECAILAQGKIGELFSLDVGAIRLKELFLDGKEDLLGARDFIAEVFKQLPKDLKSSRVFGIGGSIRAMTKIILKDSGMQFFHGMEIEAEKYIQFCKKILSSSSNMLREMGFGEDRIDSIKSGALIFSSFLESVQAKVVIASGVGVREGVFLQDLLRGGKFPHHFNPSLRSLLDRFGKKDSKEVKKEALKIFETLSPLAQVQGKDILALCASLSYIGEGIGSYAQSLHSGYLAFYGLEYGFSYEQRVVIKTILEHAEKKLPKDHQITLFSLQELRFLTSILTLARFLTLTPSVLNYRLKDQTLLISGASYLAREQIIKNSKIIDFSIEFEEVRIENHLHKVYF